MADKILFQWDRLTVADSHLTVGKATVFYSSVSAVSIYEGRPMLPMAVVGAIGLVPVAFIFFLGSRLFGPYFPTGAIAFTRFPLLVIIAIRFFYEVKCLFVTIDGHAVAVLKSNELTLLEKAKAMIEEAKKAQPHA